MDTITRNNIFLTAWEKTLIQTCFYDNCGSPCHFVGEIINSLYPDNNTFNSFDEVSADLSVKMSSNNTLLENTFFRYWGTYPYDPADQDLSLIHI